MIDEEAFEYLAANGDFASERPCAICQASYSPGITGGEVLCEFCEEDNMDDERK